jgi:hypothetical protein
MTSNLPLGNSHFTFISQLPLSRSLHLLVYKMTTEKLMVNASEGGTVC